MNIRKLTTKFNLKYIEETFGFTTDLSPEEKEQYNNIIHELEMIFATQTQMILSKGTVVIEDKKTREIYDNQLKHFAVVFQKNKNTYELEFQEHPLDFLFLILIYKLIFQAEITSDDIYCMTKFISSLGLQDYIIHIPNKSKNKLVSAAQLFGGYYLHLWPEDTKITVKNKQSFLYKNYIKNTNDFTYECISKGGDYLNRLLNMFQFMNPEEDNSFLTNFIKEVIKTIKEIDHE